MPAAVLRAGEASIARLLSVSSAKTDPSLSRLLSISSVKTDPSLSDVASGYCGDGRNATKSTSNASIISDISSLGRNQRYVCMCVICARCLTRLFLSLGARVGVACPAAAELP